MVKPKFYGKVVGGKFEAENRRDLELYLSRFEGKEVYAVFTRRGKPRTTGAPGEGSNQNGYLWGVCIKLIADEIGEIDLDYVYHWVLLKVGHFKEMPDGTRVPLATSDMEAGPFQDLCKRIQTWAAQPGNICEMGMYIPDPHEVEYDR